MNPLVHRSCSLIGKVLSRRSRRRKKYAQGPTFLRVDRGLFVDLQRLERASRKEHGEIPPEKQPQAPSPVAVRFIPYVLKRGKFSGSALQGSNMKPQEMIGLLA